MDDRVAARRAFRLPASRRRRKPSEIAYAASDRPTKGLLLALAGQHTGMAIALSAYALVAARLAGLSVADTQSFLVCTILGMAVATFLQSWGGRLGAGALIVHIPDPIMIPFVAIVLRDYGLGGLLATGIAASLPAIGISGFIPRLRVMFPPAVIGVMVCMGGFSLITGASQHALGLDKTLTIDPGSVLIAGVTITVIVVLSVWGTKTMKLFGLLAGIVAGVLVAALSGYLDGLELFASTPVAALPNLPSPVFSIDFGLIAVISMVALLVQFDTFGSVVIMDKMDDADWRRPDMRMIGRGILANGIGNLAAGLAGGMPNGPSSANIGLSHATRSTSRWIGIAAAIAIALIAFLPQITLALTLIPIAVIGAIEVYAAAFLIVSGLELAASRALDSRGIFIIGMSLICGLGVMLMPGLTENAPDGLRYVFGSGFVMAGLTAVVLNLLFRIGTSMQAVQPLDADPAISRTITDFIETQGARWSARREVVSRAALAGMETSELLAIYGHGRRPTAVRARFDEFNFDVEISHRGPPIALGGMQTPDIRHLLDADDQATELAMANISHVLVQRLADKVRTGSRDGVSFVHLHFSH